MQPNERESTSAAPVIKRRTNRISVFNEEFDLSLFILIAVKNWKLIALVVVLAIVASVVYLRYAQRIYEENCTIQVGSKNTANKVLNNTANGLYQGGADEVAESTELMRSTEFLKKVFKSIPGMAISYYTEGTFKNYEKYENSPYKVELDSNAKINLIRSKVYIQFITVNSGKIAFNKAVGPNNSISFTTGQWFTTAFGKLRIIVNNPLAIKSTISNLRKDVEFFKVNDYTDLAKYYAGKITVKILNPEAKTIGISCSDFDDQKAADIANTIGNLYIEEVVKQRGESAESILAFVNQQLDTIYVKIKATEIQMSDIQPTDKIQPNQDIATATITRLNSLDEQIAALESNQDMLTRAETIINNEKDADPIKMITQLNIMDETGLLKDVLEKLHQLINARDLALNDITPDNKTIIEINNQIQNQKEIIQQSLDAINEKLHTKIKELEDRKDAIQIKEVTEGNNGINTEYLRLQRQITIDEKYYDDLLDKKAEYAISKAGFVPESTILESASPSWIPVSPKKTVTMTIAILIAIVIIIVFLAFVYIFYNNITSIEEIERLIDSPITILGIIPKYTKDIPPSQIIVNHNPKSILAESFRSIRTNLQFISSDTGSKIISITSTISGEGKTFVSVNLGGIIAYSGKRVIILDLDMRRPRIHSAFGMENLKGMSTLLIGKYNVEDVIQKTETDNLDVITAGPIPPNPSELVISKVMDDILVKLKTMYDVIIVDNPPVGLVTDGIAMLRRADYPIYLMRVDYSKREFIYFIDRLYYENQFHKLSIILNGVDFNRQKYGYSYYKYGYYGYGYGYTYGHGNYYET